MEQTPVTLVPNRIKYNTRFSQLCLATGQEPEMFIRNRINQATVKIFKELQVISQQRNLPMVTMRTLQAWIQKVRNQIIEENKPKKNKLIKH